MKPDPEIMDRFLSHIFGNELRGLVELAWRDPQDGKLRHAQLFRLDDLDALIAKAVEVNSQEGANAYVGAATQKRFSQTMLARGFEPKRQGGTGRHGFVGIRLIRADYTDDPRHP
jgi:hypothetical protein